MGSMLQRKRCPHMHPPQTHTTSSPTLRTHPGCECTHAHPRWAHSHCTHSPVHRTPMLRAHRPHPCDPHHQSGYPASQRPLHCSYFMCHEKFHCLVVNWSCSALSNICQIGRICELLFSNGEQFTCCHILSRKLPPRVLPTPSTSLATSYRAHICS